MSRPLYLTISTPLDSQEPFFRINRLEGSETISGDFRYTVELLSYEQADLDQLIGNRLTVTIRFPGEDGKEAETCFNGVVTHIVNTRFGAMNANRVKCWLYECELRSFLAPLSRTRDFRIFQKTGQTAHSIVTELLQELRYTDLENKVGRKCKEIPFCVQYDESVTNFFNRMLESEGIGYHFVHDQNRHMLVMRDDFSAVPDCTGVKTAKIRSNMDWNRSDKITSFCTESRILTGKQIVSDYYYANHPRIWEQRSIQGGMETLTTMEYPTGAVTLNNLSEQLRNRVYAEEVQGAMVSGEGYVRSFRAGHKFKVASDERPDLDGQEYVLHSVNIVATQKEYKNSFLAFPRYTPFRPELKTKKPRIYGPQTAIVVGDGEKVDMNPHGSVRVHFHWDLINKPDAANSSCYVRCAFPSAGKNRGMQFPPYIGDEVVVTFENGDPDYPLITGVVYGGGGTVPQSVRKHPRRSILKTAEEPDSNQLMFEDKPGKEFFNVLAKKNMNRTVQNWETTHVYGSRQTFIQKGSPAPDDTQIDHLVVEGNRKVMVKKEDSQEVHINEGSFTHTVAKSATISIGGNYTLTVDGENLTIEATKGNLILRGKTVQMESTDGDVAIKSAKAVAVNAGTDIAAESGKAITMTSGTEITAESGTVFNSKSGTAFKIEAGMDLFAKGLMKTNIEGGLGVVVKGLKVNIN